MYTYIYTELTYYPPSSLGTLRTLGLRRRAHLRLGRDDGRHRAVRRARARPGAGGGDAARARLGGQFTLLESGGRARAALLLVRRDDAAARYA